MKNAEFLESYSRTQPKDCELPSDLETLMAPAREWSGRLGELLYDRLDTGPDEATAAPCLEQYSSWYQKAFFAINTAIVQDTRPESLRCTTELNFHRMSGVMLAQWMMALTPDLADGVVSRQQSIRLSQYLLAELGLFFYDYRENESSASANYSYFDKSRRDVRLVQEALVTEYDAAQVLLNVAQRHSGMSVVPAPAQFEHATAKCNADFIVLNDLDKAVGVQVKTFVTSADRDRYDPDRIVLVDGKSDFGNQMYRRTSSNKGGGSIVGWAGVISSHQVLATKDARRQIRELRQFGITPERVLHYRNLARRQVGTVKSTVKSATDIVEKRVIRSLDS